MPADFRYPAVLKPVDGAGAVDTIVIDSADSPVTDELFPHPAGVLQPYLPGSPMSASFLVSTGGRARLLAVGEQEIVRDGPRLQYRGGRLIPEVERCDGQVRRAVEAVPGLRGFVGVDFLRDEATGRTTVLEINPRPTTSAHAIVALLAPGALASEWLRPLDPSAPDPTGLPALVRPSVPFPFSVSDKPRRPTHG